MKARCDQLRWVALVGLIGFVAMTPCAYADQAAPNWSGRTSNGGTIDFYADTKNQVSVLMFWASWCPFCATLMPQVQIVANRFQGEDVRFFALNVWDKGDPISYLNARRYTFEPILGATPIAKLYGLSGTPGLIVVDQARRIRWSRPSGMRDADIATALGAALQTLTSSAQTPRVVGDEACGSTC